MLRTFQIHWLEYLIEATGLGAFMMLAGLFSTLLYADASPLPQLLPSPFGRRILMGIAMGLTAIALIYSPWGKRSGAHINPAVTLAFFRLGKLTRCDTLFYILAQFIGGWLGILTTATILGEFFTRAPVNYIITIPGSQGWLTALVTELLMSFGLMLTVLIASNHSHLSRYTGIFSGGLVAIFITFAAPISGMSINPARTFASALPADVWTAFWSYYFGPPLAMLAAAEVYQKMTQRAPRDLCGKLCPNSDTPCPCIDCPCI